MDIREIRIGDIVTTNGKPMGTKEGDYYQVIEIDSKNKLDDLVGSAAIESVSDKYSRVGAWVDYLNPIVLTDEIIKKIGFTPIGDSRFALTDAALLKYDAINYMFVTRYTHKLIKYIHQLQHEIWEAGIELKIEL